MIPRTVHWLDLSAGRFERKRISALENMLPGYEFIGWDLLELSKEDLPEEIVKMLEGPSFERASSYLCAHLLYRYGGIYMDPATVLFRDLSDMSPAGMYCFREFVPERMKESSSLLNAYGNALGPGSIPGSGISTAMMASEKGHPLLERYMQLFTDNVKKIKKEKDLLEEDLWAMAMRSWGLRYLDELQVLYYGVLVYPSGYLPSDPGQLGPLSLGLSLRGDPWQRKGRITGGLAIRKALRSARAHARTLEEIQAPAPVMPSVGPEEEEETLPGSAPEAFFSAMEDDALPENDPGQEQGEREETADETDN